MSAPEPEKAKLRLVMGHVLFLDIVGYSKLLMNEQSEALQDLNQIVREADAVCEADKAGQLIRLPTGDGMALVFTDSLETPVEAALQISQALRLKPDWLICALAERDWSAAEQALTALGNDPFMVDWSVRMSRDFAEGLLARARGEEARAQRAFGAARAEEEALVQKQSNYGPAVCMLGLIDAALGHKEAALAEGRRAMELLPMSKDANDGQRLQVYFALIAAWAGEKDLALEQLAATAATPGGSTIASYGMLKLLPFWDPLRGDPRFEKVVASLAPKN
ncbi:MAG: hypothetical protein M3Y03_05060 [Verrucomicrobiota bacterium]|nr:hypothetical protein [Verrucomicrobiota bacterium]